MALTTVTHTTEVIGEAVIGPDITTVTGMDIIMVVVAIGEADVIIPAM